MWTPPPQKDWYILACLTDFFHKGAQPDDPLFCTPGGGRVTSRGLVQVWSELCSLSTCYDDVGEQSLRGVSEHTPRRSGTQFHIKRGLQLWQVQYIGRWGGSTVELYAAEAFADLRSSWAVSVAQGRCPNIAAAQLSADVGAALWELKEDVSSLRSVALDVQSLRQAVGDLSIGKQLGKLPDDQLVQFVQEARREESTFLPSHFQAAGFIDSGSQVFVLNRASSKAHKVSLAVIANILVAEWCTTCGWRFGRGEGVLKVGSPETNRCNKRACYRWENEAGNTGDLAICSHDSESSH